VEPSAPPALDDPGSEVLVANILRGVGSKHNDVLLQPTLDHLRDRRVRTMIVADDYSGSGGRATKYLYAWLRNRSVQSWMSYGLVELKYVSYARSTMAEQAIEQVRRLGDRRSVWYGADISSAPWTDQQRASVRDLCRRYAHRRHRPLGWQSSEGLIAFHHTVPNNLPAVLTQPRGRYGADWMPLFPAAHITPGFAVELADYSETVSPVSIATRFRQMRLARALATTDDQTVASLLTLLTAIAAGVRDTAPLSVGLGRSAPTTTTLLDAATDLGLVDTTRHLTDRGWEELGAGRRRTRRAPSAIIESEEPYYPVYARGSSDI
jgi:hypothetical protein